MQLFVPVTALAIGKRGTEALFITTDFTRDRGENLFCFRHPLKQRLIHQTTSKSPHTITESSLSLTVLLNELVSSGIPGTKAFE